MDAQAEKTLPSWFTSDQTVRAMREKHEAEILTKRKEAAARIEDIRRNAEATIERLQSVCDAAQTELKLHDQARAAIQEKARTAAAELMRKKLDFEAERSNDEKFLLTSYDPQIDRAIEFFRNDFEATRQKKAVRQTRKGATDVFTLNKETIIFSNGPAINARICYARCTLEALEAMRLEPVFDPEKVKALKNGIPSIDELTEFSNQRPIEAPSDPADTTHEWTMARLLSKVNRQLRR